MMYRKLIMCSTYYCTTICSVFIGTENKPSGNQRPEDEVGKPLRDGCIAQGDSRGTQDALDEHCGIFAARP